MNDKMPVRVLHGSQNLLKYSQALPDIEAVRIAVRRHRLTGDVFERQIRLPRRTEPRVVQPRDVGVRELCEYFALAAESLDQLAAVESRVGQLQRDSTVDHAITAASAPDCSHATAADFLLDDIRPHLRPWRQSRWRNGVLARLVFREQLRQGVEKIPRLGCGMLLEKLPQFACVHAVLSRQGIEPPLPLFGRDIQCRVQQLRQDSPFHRIERAPGSEAHDGGDSWSAANRSRRAFSQSLRTVRAVRPSDSAICSSVSPAK